MSDVAPSGELRAVMLRYYARWQAGDFDSIRELISAKPYLLIIGTDRGVVERHASAGSPLAAR